MDDSNEPRILVVDLGDGWTRKRVENWRQDRHGDEGVLTYYTMPETQILLVVKRTGLKANSDEEGFKKALESGYLMEMHTPDGYTIYVPTREAIRAICDTRTETVMYNFALHTGVSIGTGHRRVLPAD